MQRFVWSDINLLARTCHNIFAGCLRCQSRIECAVFNTEFAQRPASGYGCVLVSVIKQLAVPEMYPRIAMAHISVNVHPVSGGALYLLATVWCHFHSIHDFGHFGVENLHDIVSRQRISAADFTLNRNSPIGSLSQGRCKLKPCHRHRRLDPDSPFLFGRFRQLAYYIVVQLASTTVSIQKALSHYRTTSI